MIGWKKIKCLKKKKYMRQGNSLRIVILCIEECEQQSLNINGLLSVGIAEMHDLFYKATELELPFAVTRNTSLKISYIGLIQRLSLHSLTAKLNISFCTGYSIKYLQCLTYL